MVFPEEFYLSEVREGYYVPSMMKRNWASQLEVLEEVDRVCKLHNIKYYINSGTMLGAYRHKGFIPWDDDIDVVMFREDYDKFYSVAYKDLSPEMHPINCENYPKYVEMHGRVINSIGCPITDKAIVEKYHGFALPAGIDLFVMDYLPDSASARDDFFLRFAPIEVMILQLHKIWEDKKLLNKEFKEAEEVIGYKLPRANEYAEQLRLLQKKYLEIVRKNVGKNYHYAGQVNFWANHKHYGVEEVAWYSEQVMLPFEHIELPSHIGVKNTLKEWFGESYMKVGKYGSHSYPYFFKTMVPEIYANPYIDNHLYSVPRDEWMERKPVEGLSFIECVRNKVETLKKLRLATFGYIESSRFEEALALLEKLQNIAVEIGSLIEDRYLTSAEDEEKVQALSIVGVLEAYCEALFGISNGDSEALQQLLICEEQLGNRVSVFNPQRKLVVFMPDRSSHWGAMEAAYREAKSNPQYEVRVVPIPFYYKGRSGELETELRYEGDMFPSDVEVTDYGNFAFNNPYCDIIVVQNAYDNMDDGYSVHPFFYSDKLQTYAKEVIYIPWFKIDEIKEDEPGMQIAVFFANIPGVVRADKVILESENMKCVYMQALAKILNEENHKKMYDKLIVSEQKIL